MGAEGVIGEQRGEMEGWRQEVKEGWRGKCEESERRHEMNTKERGRGGMGMEGRC